MEMVSTEVDALWRKLVKSFYEPDGTFSSSSVRNMRHGTWCDIINALSSIDDIDPSNKSANVGEKLLKEQQQNDKALLKRNIQAQGHVASIGGFQSYYVRSRWEYYSIRYMTTTVLGLLQEAAHIRDVRIA
ncbi:hypothetical protein Tco_0987583 [Tanacetum coccineum]